MLTNPEDCSFFEQFVWLLKEIHILEEEEAFELLDELTYKKNDMYHDMFLADFRSWEDYDE